MQIHRSRSRHLITLSLLMGATSLFAWLWFVLLPASLFLANHLALLFKPPAIVLVLSSLSLLGLITAGGLWFSQIWAFRVGMMLVVCTLALDLLWVILSFSIDLFELGALLLFVLSCVSLFLFLEPTVARDLVSPRPC